MTPFVGPLALGMALGAIGGAAITRVSAQVALPPFTETPLFRADLSDLPGRELIVSRLVTAPGWVHGRHFHAGHELVYVLEGSAVLEVDGKSPVELGPGAFAHVPPRQIHRGRNASASAPLRFLLIRIHEKGQPISVELGP
jgi:quercetin dioxygenase-like cupin family protein